MNAIVTGGKLHVHTYVFGTFIHLVTHWPATANKALFRNCNHTGGHVTSSGCSHRTTIQEVRGRTQTTVDPENSTNLCCFLWPKGHWKPAFITRCRFVRDRSVGWRWIAGKVESPRVSIEEQSDGDAWCFMKNYIFKYLITPFHGPHPGNTHSWPDETGSCSKHAKNGIHFSNLYSLPAGVGRDLWPTVATRRRRRWSCCWSRHRHRPYSCRCCYCTWSLLAWTGWANWSKWINLIKTWKLCCFSIIAWVGFTFCHSSGSGGLLSCASLCGWESSCAERWLLSVWKSYLLVGKLLINRK